MAARINAYSIKTYSIYIREIFVYGLLQICSTEAQRIEEIEDLRNLLIDNNYPPHIIENEFKRFEKYKQLNVEKTPNQDEKIKYLSIPFINDKSETISRTWKYWTARIQ